MTPIWVVVAIVVVLVGVLAVAESVVLEEIVLLVDTYLGCSGSSSSFDRSSFRSSSAPSMTHLQAPSDRSNKIKTRLSHNQTLHQLSS